VSRPDRPIRTEPASNVPDSFRRLPPTGRWSGNGRGERDLPVVPGSLTVADTIHIPPDRVGGSVTDETAALARAYYGAIDAGAYDRLADLLAPEFVHRRPDRTLVGRESFVEFMRSGRPRTDTTHAVDALYRQHGAPDDPVEVAVRGRLLADGGGRPDGDGDGRGTDEDDETLFGFVDVFVVESGRLVSLRTYSD
jgi:hypothetical protein